MMLLLTSHTVMTLQSSQLVTGTAQGGANGSITLQDNSNTNDDYYKNYFVQITTSDLAITGQMLKITSMMEAHLLPH